MYKFHGDRYLIFQTGQRLLAGTVKGKLGLVSVLLAGEDFVPFSQEGSCQLLSISASTAVTKTATMKLSNKILVVYGEV